MDSRPSHNMTQPSIYFVCYPDTNVPIGGVKMLYRHVDVLNKNGFSAFIIHDDEGFRCDWFENQTQIAYLPNIKLKADDFFVMPETATPKSGNLLPGIRKVIYNQGCYNTFYEYSLDKHQLETPYHSRDVVAVLVASENSLNYLNYVFPQTRLFRIHHSIDANLFYYQPVKKKQICWLDRKMQRDAQQVINILKFRNALNGFELIPIQNKPQKEVAQIFRQSLMFLSFCYAEGFSLPPAEAMASGCLAVGYHGWGGKEYFLPDFSFPVESGDIIGFAHTVEKLIATYNTQPQLLMEKHKKAADFIKQNYSAEQEERDIVTAWREIIKLPKG
ncbi:glycosyltransferase [Laspinema olomoucense]|uniref:glycosyltransferase n=1 Tax=Laspinema olomoucense TaxID=3231600 RepID=UPI0021BA43AA|nr:glycosyltransferase [Laspinema sp. D3c]MCT7992300.1 glycosyltransferase [Laspinema sp. D3c]